ncbi:MAG: DUF3667 domain-containing protein [Flavobacterium sp.]|uniref:DUF3667 domain-containing protein n=1 Tax=Flavobacterium sp. TaxID=239 RepID=UPI0022C85ECF|nr:DUF3667 domain-containing protein [Flavobacterium sp.]MCZ8197887.1 DUF3667 domain-containing protein [Flavobacterium sp.]
MIHCLNCNHEVASNFCPNCGQKATVHKYSVKHFIEHDLVHGILHVDKGILYTIKMLFTSPGHSIREFIQGKRVKIFNFVTLLVLIIAVSHFLSSYSLVKMSDIMPDNQGFMKEYENISQKYPKLILLMTIPFYSIITFFWFKKAKLNLTEHFVLNSYKTAGELLILILFTLISIFYTNISGLGLILAVISLGSYIYNYWFYRQFFSEYGYTKKSLVIRSIMSVISYFFISILVGLCIALFMLLKNKILT